MHVKLLRIVRLSRIWQHFSDVVYSICVTRARSQNFETITGDKLAAREKCRLIQTEAERRRREAGVKQSMEIRLGSCMWVGGYGIWNYLANQDT